MKDPSPTIEPLLPTHLDLWQQTLGWQPQASHLADWQRLYQQLLEVNRHLNLTRITAPEEFWEKHLWDSLRGIKPWLNADAACFPASTPAQVIDIGSGGGFPGLPVAVATRDCPGWKLSLLDSTRKKIAFLEQMGGNLGLSIQAIAERAETSGQQPNYRERYDLALIRAVGSAPTCAEYALPFVKVGGTAVLYRGQWTPEEADGLRQAALQLGAEVVQVDCCQTPLTGGIRHYIFLQKQYSTRKQFPRAVGIPAKFPLPN